MATKKVKAEIVSMKLKIYKTHKDHELPKFQTEQAACFDIQAQFKGKAVYVGYNANNTKFERNFANDTMKLMPGDRMMIPAGIILDIPKGYSVRVHPRSGLAIKSGLAMVNSEGIIDSDFIDELSVLLINTSNNPFVVRHGDRIAQAELVPQLTYEIAETKTAPKVKTNRTGGLGSTGISEEAKDVVPST